MINPTSNVIIPLESIGENTAWALILELRRLIRDGKVIIDHEIGFSIDPLPAMMETKSAAVFMTKNHGRTWSADIEVSPAAAQLFELYLPICFATAHRPLTIGHLGQSLDGRIATEEGASCYVTGPENLTHLHRMRAICDAILVGAATVANDDPQLTTRRVSGNNPVRVALDPQNRLHGNFKIFKDNAAPTLILYGATAATKKSHVSNQVEMIPVPIQEGRLCLSAILKQLHQRGLYSVFVEGGGITVSRFLQAGLLDRLQIAIAPLIIGSGRPGITLPPIHNLDDGLRPRHRRFTMGEDVLFDCELSS